MSSNDDARKIFLALDRARELCFDQTAPQPLLDAVQTALDTFYDFRGENADRWLTAKEVDALHPTAAKWEADAVIGTLQRMRRSLVSPDMKERHGEMVVELINMFLLMDPGASVGLGAWIMLKAIDASCAKASMDSGQTNDEIIARLVKEDEEIQ